MALTDRIEIRQHLTKRLLDVPPFSEESPTVFAYSPRDPYYWVAVEMARTDEVRIEPLGIGFRIKRGPRLSAKMRLPGEPLL